MSPLMSPNMSSADRFCRLFLQLLLWDCDWCGGCWRHLVSLRISSMGFGTSVWHLIRLLSWSCHPECLFLDNTLSVPLLTWRRYITSHGGSTAFWSELQELGIRSHLSIILQDFLFDRAFHIRLDNSIYPLYMQENEVPLGSVLSVTLCCSEFSPICWCFSDQFFCHQHVRWEQGIFVCFPALIFPAWIRRSLECRCSI